MTLDLHAELLQRGAALILQDTSPTRVFAQRWSAAFASALPIEQRAYRWHSFSFRRHQCLEGAAALSAYLGQWRAPFFVFDETLSFCALCEADAYPDLTDLRQDVYITHSNLKWTMAFTHEQPQLGPFFAQQSAA